jgi:hypothetical protein
MMQYKVVSRVLSHQLAWKLFYLPYLIILTSGLLTRCARIRAAIATIESTNLVVVASIRIITESISKVRRVKSWKVTFCQGIAVDVTVLRTIFFLRATLHELGWSKILLRNRNNSLLEVREVSEWLLSFRFMLVTYRS